VYIHTPIKAAYLNAVSWFLKALLMRSVPVKAAILMPTMLIVLHVSKQEALIQKF
jgi:hypothetical protein